MAWDALRDPSPMQTFSTHIIHLISDHSKHPSLYELGIGLPLSRWLETWSGWFQAMHVGMLVIVGREKAAVTSKLSPIRHPYAGIGTSTAKQFGRRIYADNYNWSVVYEDLSQRHHAIMRYKHHSMAVSRETFQKW